MKLSQITRSQPIVGGCESWGIYLSPEDSCFLVKLFCNEQDFYNEKKGYDRMLGNPRLKHLVNQYTEIDIQLDTGACDLKDRNLPIEKALLHPYLQIVTWKDMGKLSETSENSKYLTDNGLDVEGVSDALFSIGVAWWEASVFMRFNPCEFRLVDLTYNEDLEEMYKEGNE